VRYRLGLQQMPSGRVHVSDRECQISNTVTGHFAYWTVRLHLDISPTYFLDYEVVTYTLNIVQGHVSSPAFGLIKSLCATSY